MLQVDDTPSPTESAAYTSAPDDDSTIRMSAHKTPKASQEPIPGLLQEPIFASPLQPDALTVASNQPTMIFSNKNKATGLLQEPVPTLPPQPDALTVASNQQTTIFSSKDKVTGLLQEPAPTLPPQPDALTVASNQQTIIFSSKDKATGLLQEPVPTLPPQPDALTVASNQQTIIFSARDTRVAEPFISHFPGANTVQNKPEPFFTSKTFSSPFPERDSRIVADPPYPRLSHMSTQSIRENTHPAIIGIAAAILVVFLGMLWWWNSGKTDDHLENADALPPTISPPGHLPNAEPSMPPSTLTSPAKDTPASNPKLMSEQGSELELISIPSLPMNQRQGRHNSTEVNIEIKDNIPPSPYSSPLPATPAPKPAEIAVSPPQKPAATNTRPDTPPWINQMRQDLSDCWDVFCREKVRAQYCTSRWENLPECKGTSL
ncbi:MAG: hypothetical protein FWD67_04505 [Betaproteobacteria bacterium]|nr:hypothetical protein [Betaproteobacteria bacterium]